MRGRGGAGGIAACLLGFMVLQIETAAASCPDWAPPRVPTIEEARTSTLCKGTPYEVRVEALKRADPEADANAQAGRGSFRLLRFTSQDSECGPQYPRSFEAKCNLTPETTVVEHQKPYLEAFEPLWKVRWRIGDDSPPETHCATVFGTLIEDYVSRFNRTLIEHSRYPNKDLCRHVPFKGDWSEFWKERSRAPDAS